MRPAALLLTVAVMLAAAGAVSAVLALNEPVGTKPPRTRLRSAEFRVSRGQLFGVAAAVLTLIVTGWPVAAAGVGLGVWFVPSVVGGGKAAAREIERVEAVAQWTRRLANLLGTGGVGSLDQALRRSVEVSPEPIAEHVANLVSRMGPQGMEPALRMFAGELNNRAAEKVAGALILRARQGGRGLAVVLEGLAADLDERVRMTRDIEAERAKPRGNTRTIVILIAGLVVGELVFARQFLEPYGTLLGEIALAVIIAVFAVSLRWIRRMSEPLRQPRVLTDPRAGRGAV